MYNQDQNKTFCIEIVPPTMPFENMLSSDNFYFLYSLIQNIDVVIYLIYYIFLCNSIELSQYICKSTGSANSY